MADQDCDTLLMDVSMSDVQFGLSGSRLLPALQRIQRIEGAITATETLFVNLDFFKGLIDLRAVCIHIYCFSPLSPAPRRT